jgi:hypothetical protein
VKSVVARLLFTLVVLVLSAANAFALAYGATREEVVKELGQPLAHAQLGSREILTYPKKVRVELEDGHVVSADHIILKIVDPTPTPAPTENPVEHDTPIATAAPSTSVATTTIAPTPAPTPTPTPSPEPTLAPTPTNTPTTVPTATPTSTRVGTVAPGPKTVSAKAPTHALTPTPAPARTPAPALNADTFKPVSLFDASELPLAGKIMLLAFHFAATLMAVYFAFRIWNVDALTTGIIIIAVIDTLLHCMFEALGPMTSGLSTMSAVENGIPGIVMIFTVRHFSFGKKIPEAVRVAAAVKAVVFAVKLIATAALLDFVFPVH